MSAMPRIARISLLVLVALIPASLAEGRAVPGAPSCPMTPADSFWHADVSGAARARPVGDRGSRASARPRGSRPTLARASGTAGRSASRTRRCPARSRGCPCRSATPTRATPGRIRSRRTPRSREARARRATATSSSSIAMRAGCGSCTARIRRTAALRGRPDPARPGALPRTRCARSAGRPATPRDCRSCPVSSATTRSRRARSTTSSASPPRGRPAPTSGRRATRPRPAAPRIRRWAPGSG